MVSLHQPATARRSTVHWISPEPGVWVATRRGEHAGTVERRNGSYHATNGRGRELGSFDDLDSALTVIDGFESRSRVARPRGVVMVALWVIIGGSALGALLLGVALYRG